jgi:hypothetical protein
MFQIVLKIYSSKKKLLVQRKTKKDHSSRMPSSMQDAERSGEKNISLICLPGA